MNLMHPSSSEALFAILKIIRTHPSAYLGHTTHYYSGLAGFISGFVQGSRYAANDQNLAVLPAGFNDFVLNALGISNNDQMEHWIDALLLRSGTQEAAFEFF